MPGPERCPYKIRWTFGTDAQCTKTVHIETLEITPLPDGRLMVDVTGISDQHEARAELPDGPRPGSILTWLAGDRREFTGDWPGPCEGKVPGCTLHTGHNGRCAP